VLQHSGAGLPSKAAALVTILWSFPRAREGRRATPPVSVWPFLFGLFCLAFSVWPFLFGLFCLAFSVWLDRGRRALAGDHGAAARARLICALRPPSPDVARYALS